MGTGTIGGISLQNVTQAEKTYPKLNAEHEIPGGVSIMQLLGRKRNLLKVHGILSPAQEVTNVAAIGAIANTATITASVSIGGKDYGGGTWALESVDTSTLAGVSVSQPWGSYVITLREVS